MNKACFSPHDLHASATLFWGEGLAAQRGAALGNIRQSGPGLKPELKFRCTLKRAPPKKPIPGAFGRAAGMAVEKIRKNLQAIADNLRLITQEPSEPFPWRTMMENLTPDQARTILDYFLPSIEAEHKITRLLIQMIPHDKLDFQPELGGKTVADLIWENLMADNHGLTAICDAQLPSVAEKPEHIEPAGVLAWDDERFPNTYQRLAQLSGEDLLRPLDFYGLATQPAVAFLQLYASQVAANRMHLAVYLRLAGVLVPQPVSAVEASRSAAGELNESELAAVAGGTLTLISGPPNPNSTITITTTPGYLETSGPANATLGSLFQSQGGTQSVLVAAIPAFLGASTGAAFGALHTAMLVSLSLWF